MLSVAQFTYNPFQENTYLLYDKATREAFIVDPGCYTTEEQNDLLQFLKEQKLQPKAILLTHAHIDHVLGLAALQAQYAVPTYLHPDEAANFAALSSYAPLFGIHDYVHGKTDQVLQAGDRLSIGDRNLSVRKVPGHAPGHVVFYEESQQILIAGDTLFYESIGRTDLPGGDHETLLQAIREELYTLPDTVKVYPGHGPLTHIGHEKQQNPFVRMSA